MKLDSLVVPNSWELEDALVLIRALQPQTRRFHYHLCLGGGVMNTGRSSKDLDLYFLPLSNGSTPKPSELLEWLEGMWGACESLGDYPTVAAPYVECGKFMYGLQRIDVFVMGSDQDHKDNEEEALEETPEGPRPGGGIYAAANNMLRERAEYINIVRADPHIPPPSRRRQIQWDAEVPAYNTRTDYEPTYAPGTIVPTIQSGSSAGSTWRVIPTAGGNAASLFGHPYFGEPQGAPVAPPAPARGVPEANED